MHDIEAGHKCPTCSNRSLCLIEDGYCENGGECDTCIRGRYYDQARNDREGYDYD